MEGLQLVINQFPCSELQSSERALCLTGGGIPQLPISEHLCSLDITGVAAVGTERGWAATRGECWLQL